MKFVPALLFALTLLFTAACSQAPAEPKTVALSIEGMTCENCVAGIQQSLNTLPGFQACTIDLETGNATVTFDPDTLSAEEISQRINLLGFTSVIQENTPAPVLSETDG